jgi:hypothetical protein
MAILAGAVTLGGIEKVQPVPGKGQWVSGVGSFSVIDGPCQRLCAKGRQVTMTRYRPANPGLKCIQGRIIHGITL